jgi:DNA modification methylase
MSIARIIHGDCRAALKKLPAASFDLILTDPPYPCVPREYGVWTEEEWFDLMDAVVPEFRRLLKPSGSAVIVLQPNSEKAGRMRLWMWEFLAKWGRAWNVVQDAYQWNHTQLPFGACTTKGLLRGSVKHCVWLGEPDCYRNQGAVLWEEADDSKRRRLATRAHHKTTFTSPSASKRSTPAPRLDQGRVRAAVARRGGVTPFNLIPAANSDNADSDHPARTPADLVNWWLRYACPPGGSVLDPFAGSGTTLWESAAMGLSATGVEADAGYVRAMRARVKATA